MSEFDHLLDGYRIDLEDPTALKATSFDGWEDRVKGLFSAPEEMDPRAYHRVEHQGQQGACQGHALTSVVEHCYHIATGEVIHFSRQYGYVGAQKIDGIRGDRGSTIHGGMKLATTRGLCREELWPYTGRYVVNPPNSTWNDLYADASRYVIRSHSVLRTYQQVFDYLASGIGAVEIGVSWGVPNSPVVERYTASGGGHAVAFMGYSKRRDSQGRKYLWLLNSWGQTWGNKGWAEVSPAVVDSMGRAAYTVMIGMSDLDGEGIAPRPVDWSVDGYMTA